MVPPPFSWAWLGRVSYRRAWALQEELRRRVLDERGGDTLLLLEHDPVITLGRGADPDHVLASPAALAAQGVEVVATSRGGDVTYHGPGQLVGYPVFRLRRGVRDHVETLAAALCALCAELGVAATWRPDPVGVWVGGDKLAAFGVHVHRQVAIHGFALNVTTPLDAFHWIVPCGLRRAGVASLAALGAGPDAATPAGLAARVAGAVAAAFARRGEPVAPAALWQLLSDGAPVQSAP